MGYRQRPPHPHAPHLHPLNHLFCCLSLLALTPCLRQYQVSPFTHESQIYLPDLIYDRFSCSSFIKRPSLVSYCIPHTVSLFKQPQHYHPQATPDHDLPAGSRRVISQTSHLLPLSCHWASGFLNIPVAWKLNWPNHSVSPYSDLLHHCQPTLVTQHFAA